MSTNAKLTSVFVALLVGLVASIAIIQYWGNDAPPTEVGSSPGEIDSNLLVRQDSRYLSQAADGKVTLVEFLDFECEACLAMYPTMEQLRADYGDRITFVVRYFPLPGHPNSVTAATAVEAAAQLGAFEQMYKRVFETQTAWGHTESSQQAVFIQFAEELGLDATEFQRIMDDPGTLARVQRDVDDGRALQIQGTPTIYINGMQTGSMPTYAELVAMIDEALATDEASSRTHASVLATIRRDDSLQPMSLIS